MAVESVLGAIIADMNREELPPLLRQINDPPKQLHYTGNILPLFDPANKILCVVGARKYSTYGKDVVEKLITGLKGYPICIISGLALGIDSIAHEAALTAGLYTAAFPGSGLDPSVLYPASHLHLAEKIIAGGGALLSEFDPFQKSAPWTFPSRNRLMAGVSHATLVVEAELKSGTLITSARATDYNREVGAIPGPIFSPLSAGPHMLIRLGASPITCVDDLLELLGFPRRNGQSSLVLPDKLSPDEKRVFEALRSGQEKDQISRNLSLDPKTLNMIISSLEIEGLL